MKVFPAREAPVPQITVGLEGRTTDLDFTNSEYIQKVDRQFCFTDWAENRPDCISLIFYAIK